MMYGNMMYGTGFSVWGMILNLLLILLVVGAVVVLLTRSGAINSESQKTADLERLNRLENEVRDTKKMVEEIKDKLDEI
ncbi:hypothetical protein [Methanohalophilus halophilus]|uniref:Uncharacterized protein n=3 Tax=Methanohalophilus halophilus TaxID=2177 RepID=A0A1H2SW14_9EURY|nr:hypothetical protein [Methanohalophilus halophilus]SDW35873.1 hypothetical protein SAMN04515625_0812 [Methanohalophilus halophilus]